MYYVIEIRKENHLQACSRLRAKYHNKRREGTNIYSREMLVLSCDFSRLDHDQITTSLKGTFKISMRLRPSLRPLSSSVGMQADLYHLSNGFAHADSEKAMLYKIAKKSGR